MPTSLATLPPEVLAMIAGFASPMSLKALRLTCWTLESHAGAGLFKNRLRSREELSQAYDLLRHPAVDEISPKTRRYLKKLSVVIDLGGSYVAMASNISQRHLEPDLYPSHGLKRFCSSLDKARDFISSCPNIDQFNLVLTLHTEENSRKRRQSKPFDKKQSSKVQQAFDLLLSTVAKIPDAKISLTLNGHDRLPEICLGDARKLSWFLDLLSESSASLTALHLKNVILDIAPGKLLQNALQPHALERLCFDGCHLAPQLVDSLGETCLRHLTLDATEVGTQSGLFDAFSMGRALCDRISGGGARNNLVTSLTICGPSDAWAPLRDVSFPHVKYFNTSEFEMLRVLDMPNLEHITLGREWETGLRRSVSGIDGQRTACQWLARFPKLKTIAYGFQLAKLTVHEMLQTLCLERGITVNIDAERTCYNSWPEDVAKLRILGNNLRSLNIEFRHGVDETHIEDGRPLIFGKLERLQVTAQGGTVFAESQGTPSFLCMAHMPSMTELSMILSDCSLPSLKNDLTFIRQGHFKRLERVDLQLLALGDADSSHCSDDEEFEYMAYKFQRYCNDQGIESEVTFERILDYDEAAAIESEMWCERQGDYWDY